LGRKVLIVDDVITAGTAIREAVDILKGAGGVLVGVAVCLDLQEKSIVCHTGDEGMSFVQFIKSCMCLILVGG